MTAHSERANAGVPAGDAAASISQVTSEIAHDLLLDHMGTVLALLDAPMDHQQLVQRLGSEKTLERMLRHGLISRNSTGTYSGVARMYALLRQEGMMSFLERYVLPVLTESIVDQGMVTLHNLALQVEPEDRGTIRQGPVQSLLEQLAAITDQPRRGPASEMTVMVVGTSRILPHSDELDPGDRALEHLRQASVQRSTSSERHLALLTQFRGLADNDRYRASLGALETFLSTAGWARPCPAREANYHLTVATYWEPAQGNDFNADTERALERVELC